MGLLAIVGIILSVGILLGLLGLRSFGILDLCGFLVQVQALRKGLGNLRKALQKSGARLLRLESKSTQVQLLGSFVWYMGESLNLAIL